MTDTVARILALCDDGSHPVAIADELGLSHTRVYTILRKHRPNRSRKPRERSGQKRLDVMLDLRTTTLSPAQIAEKRQCSRWYVYRLLSEGRT